MSNFWAGLKKPFFVLAPMEDVTDIVFRQIVAGVARPDVFFTEFTNVDGLMSAGRPKLIRKFGFTSEQHPIVAQIWGLKPENYYEVAKMVAAMGFDGIDINMGCPERAVLKAGACAALIDNRNLATEIIDATKKGAGSLPVSVKTRLGLRQIQTEDWIGFLLGQKLDALTVHGRTASEMSKVPAHWDEIGKVVHMRDSLNLKTVIIGNGDIKDVADGLWHVDKFGVDGVMIGRGIFADVAAFEKSTKVQKNKSTKEEKIKLAVEHVKLFEKTWKGQKNPAILKKFFKIYINGFDGAGVLRARLMEATDYEQMVEILT
jgi:tRNA-dihydrouridine synthase